MSKKTQTKQMAAQGQNVRMTIPAPEETDNPEWIRADIAKAIEAQRDELLAALKDAVGRMEAVSEGIPVQNRAKDVSQATHVAHMAAHLAQHAKKARAAIDKVESSA